MGFWSGLGKVFKVAAPVAAGLMIPGVGGAVAKGLGGVFGKLLGRGGDRGMDSIHVDGTPYGGGGGGGGGFWSKIGDFVGGRGGDGEGGIGVGNIINAGMNASGNIAKGMSSGRDKELVNTARQQDIIKAANHQAMVAALAKNLQDVNIEAPAGITMGKVSGGLRPSALGLEGKAVADRTYDLSMDRLKHVPSAKAGVMENVLGTVGAVGQGINQVRNQNVTNPIVQELLKRQAQQTDDGSEG